MSDIRSLVVFEKLKVHDLVVEPRRVKARYTLVNAAGEEVSTDLIYSYDKVYFDRKLPADVNMASMMAAQVAMNYGLFFKIIEFDGIYDKVDQRFIRDMTENTSREIYVNKFLQPNEFLLPPFDALPVEKMEKYTAAELVFVNTQFGGMKLEPEDAQPDTNQYAILSSGGKDSLLSYGLIKEFGEPHPVFINESGRHWFTAINSHKHFKETEPNTAKPWCNSDRVFNWMVKQMPFIKPNFQNIRADIYPIRLWTVSVFLFGVLPVARKRNIGNIVIGDEYDTTERITENGITHYQGLYDQSKYFDNALTRYYKAKGWNMYQFSMLRSLGELLIMRILVNRYPDLQRHQVSCHAAHEEEGRMLPCGNCEKCRRIIGMLKAMDHDPKRCGYTDAQIKKGLTALEAKSVKQLGSDASHLYYMLLEKGLIARTEHSQRLAKAHPHILRLRFDAERSNMADLPPHVRKPLMDILLPESDGVVRFSGGKWEPSSLMPDDFARPYHLTSKK
jgi:hypothetical protein